MTGRKAHTPDSKIINYFVNKPKTLFLIDSLGAMLTAFLLLAVLRNFNEYFGMPVVILTYLSIIAMLFCIYSAICFFFLKKNWTPFIKAIGYANLLYCILTAGLLMVYYSILTVLGIAYFLVEIAVVCLLVYIEFKVAIKLT
ncbi:MAG TPA: hypothetical protein PKE30_10410 [Niabella sp.]|nr:hypothetical protein [Niabella sp.]